jgi:hypothetical protein
MAMNACSSAISLPLIPEWPGIHMMMISLPKKEALLKLFWILDAMSQGLNRFCKFFIELSESLRIMNLEWASWIITSVAIRIF